MGKKDLEPVVAKIVDELNKQKEQIREINVKLGKVTEAYLEGIKDGIAYMQKQK